jgi:hypothetical protein
MKKVFSITFEYFSGNAWRYTVVTIIASDKDELKKFALEEMSDIYDTKTREEVWEENKDYVQEIDFPIVTRS